MKCLAVLAIVVVCGTARACLLEEEWKNEDFQRSFQSCLADRELSLDGMNLLSEDAWDPAKANDDVKCAGKCLMEAVGLLDDGALDRDAMMEKFGKEYGEEKVQMVYEACKEQNGDEECEREFKILACIAKEGKK